MGLHKGQRNKGSFTKGRLPWNKGIKTGDFRKTDMKLIAKKISESNQGRIISKETRKKISGSLKGKKNNKGKTWKIKDTSNMKGRRPWNYIDGRSKNQTRGRYGDDWDEIRQMIYRRDNFTCQSCGITHIKLDVHHTIPYLDGGSNEIDNLISLCRSCHMKIEHPLIKKRKNKNNRRIDYSE